MAEGDTPYRFKNGKWEIWEDDAWWPAGEDAAALLRGYTKVKDIGQGRFVFYAENGDTMTEEVMLNQIAQDDEADRLANAPWWGPEITAAFGPYPPTDAATFAQALNYAQDLRIPGTPGVAKTPEQAPLIFGTKAEAEAEAAANGGVAVRRSDGRWGVEDAPAEAVEKARPAETFEEAFNRYLLSGQSEKAQQLWDAREAIIGRGGQMSDAEIAQWLTGDLFKAEEMPALIEALRRGPAQQGGDAFQRALEAGVSQDPLQGARALSVDAQGNALQFRDMQGNPIQNPFAATMLARPFPGAPPGTGDATTPGFSAFNPQGVLNAFLTGSQPETVPQFGIGQQPGLTPEDFDPNFEGASPEAQAAIRAELTKRQAEAFPTAKTPPKTFTEAIQADLAGVTNAERSQLQSVTQGEGFTDALRKREADLAGTGPSGQPLLSREGGNAPENQRATPSPAGQVPANTFQPAAGGFPSPEPPFDISVLSPEMQAAIRAVDTKGRPIGTASVSQSGPGGNFAEFQAGKGGELIPEPTFANAGAGPKALTFEQALAQINERRRHQQLLRKPQGRTVFA